MATCITSIGIPGQQIMELSTGVAVQSNITKDINALYLLSNELDQSVFFNVRLIGTSPNISYTITIYNATTLVSIGSMVVTSITANSSFNIKAGQYYVCIRSQLLPYTVELTPKFISYNNTIIFSPRSQYGFSSTSTLTVSRPVGICNRRLLYTIIEGKLPTGLTMLENGYIAGSLPILDVDEYNKDLPPSNTWYHKLGDDEYITNWGRAYRFKVHLTLYDDRTKEDVAWFYISIINDYSKNFALLDKYEALSDDRNITFEEKVLMDKSLCPPCGSLINDKDTDDIQDDTNGNILIDMNNRTDYINKLIEKNDNALYDAVVLNDTDDTDDENILLYQSGFGDVNMEEHIELIHIPPLIEISFNDIEPEFFISTSVEETQLDTSISGGLVQYYISNINNNDNILIDHLKESAIFQCYLIENNIGSKYVIMESVVNEQYKNINLSYINIVDEISNIKSYYIQLDNLNDINEDDSTILFNDLYNDKYVELPLTTYAVNGFHSEAKIVVPKL